LSVCGAGSYLLFHTASIRLPFTDSTEEVPRLSDMLRQIIDGKALADVMEAGLLT